MSRTRLALGSIALLLGMLLAPGMMGQAHAVSGCNTQVIDKAAHWTETQRFFDWDGAGDAPQVGLRMSGTLVYRYCPNWPMVYPKIKPLRYVWCWHFTTDRPNGFFDAFGGVRFNGYVGSKYSTTNPPEVKVDDDHSQTNCEKQGLVSGWMSMADKPHESITAWIVMAAEQDIEVIFRTSTGSHVKYIHPADDENISGWYS